MKRFGKNVTCDQCNKIVNFFKDSDFYTFKSKKKSTEMHFCNERCKLIYFKGRKYYKNKVKQMEKNNVKAN